MKRFLQTLFFSREKYLHTQLIYLNSRGEKEKSEERELSFVGIPRYTFILRRIWMNGVPSNSIKLNSHRIEPSTRLSSSVT